MCDGERATGPGTVWDHVWLAGCGGLELHPLPAARADGSAARESLGDVPQGRGWAGPLTGSCWCRRVQVQPRPQSSSRVLWVSAHFITNRGPERKSDFGRNEVSVLEIVKSQAIPRGLERLGALSVSSLWSAFHTDRRASFMVGEVELRGREGIALGVDS